MTDLRVVDFGAWAKARLGEAGVSQADLARESGFLYPSLARILNSGARGNPVKPDYDTIGRIGRALVALQVIGDEREAWAAAGYLVEGYRIVKDAPAEPPENFADWPQELQDALGYARDMTPEVQKYIFHLWREQAKAHHDIETRRREAERRLIERERQLAALEKGNG